MNQRQSSQAPILVALDFPLITVTAWPINDQKMPLKKWEKSCSPAAAPDFLVSQLHSSGLRGVF